MKTLLADLASCICKIQNPLPSVVSGFDGFVDEMITVVAERQNLDAFTSVEDIATFGGLITKAANQSSLREIVINAVHAGGCAVNMGDGLVHFGVPLDCFATLGQPMHPAFAEFAAKCRSCHSWGKEPGRTLAFEFADGKVMFSAVRQLADFDSALVESMLASGDYFEACSRAKVVALTDWTLYPHMTAVWRLLQERVYSRLTHRPTFFLDLVDPSTRSIADIRAMMETLPRFERFGPVTLGLNGNEANILARILGIEEAGDDPAAAQNLAEKLRMRLGISEVLIHRIKFAAGASAKESTAINGPYCANPMKSTGAGDRFNAGYCLGLLLGVDIRSRLTLGCASSGIFVRKARSATRAELAEFLASGY